MRYCHRLAVRNRLRITAPGSPCLSQLIMQQRPIMIPNHCSSYTACHGHGFRQSTFGNGHKRAWLCTDTAPPASGHLVPVPAPYMHKETSAGGPKKKKKKLALAQLAAWKTLVSKTAAAAGASSPTAKSDIGRMPDGRASAPWVWTCPLFTRSRALACLHYHRGPSRSMARRTMRLAWRILKNRTRPRHTKAS